MIELTCQHCGALLRMDDAFAGRDGWCRECKQMVIIPSGATIVRVEDLPPVEAIQRLQRLLSYAARKVDQHKQSVAERREAKDSRARLEAALVEARDALAGERRRSDELAAELALVKSGIPEWFAPPESTELKAPQENEAADKRLEVLCAKLEGELAAAQDARSALEADLAAKSLAMEEMQRLLERAATAESEALNKAHTLEADLAVAGSQLESARIEIESAKDEARASADALKSLRKEYDESQSDRLTIRGLLDEVERERSVAREEVETLRSELGRVETERDELARRVVVTEALLAQSEDAAVSNRDGIASLEAELSALRNSTAEVIADRDGLRNVAGADRERLLQVQADLEANRQMLAVVELERDDAVRELASSRDGLGRLDRELGALTDRLREAEQSELHLGAAEAIADRDALRNAAEANRERLLQVQADLEANRQILAVVEQERDEAVRELASSREGLERLDRELGALTDRLREAEQSELHLGAAEAIANRDALRNAAGADRERLLQVQADLEANRQMLSVVEQERDDAVRELASSREGLERLDRELGALTDRLREAEADREMLTRRVDELTELVSRQPDHTDQGGTGDNGGAARSLETYHGPGTGELRAAVAARVSKVFTQGDANGASSHAEEKTSPREPDTENADTAREDAESDSVAVGRAGDPEVSRAGFVDRWHREAEKAGSTKAQYRLGVRYERGLGVERNEAEAMRWLTRAAEHGHAGAQQHLGQMYADGRGVAQDFELAMHWFRKAADLGDVHAQCEIGKMYLDGLGVAQDEAEAAQWFQRAAEKDDARAYYLLGQRHAAEDGALRDPAKALRCFERSAKRGYAGAQYEMGKSLWSGTHLAQDDRRAAEWFSLAAEQGHREAQLAHGGCYEAGRGVVQNFAQAYAWYTLASTTLDIARIARDQLATAMTPELVLEGQVLAAEFAHRIEKATASAASV